MKRLSATFAFALPAPILYKGPGTPRSFPATVENFEIVLTLKPDGNRSKKKGERHWTYTCSEPRIVVTRAEVKLPPPQTSNPRGHSQYFADRLPAYAHAAATSFNNAIAFLRHRLRQPLLEFIGERNQGLQNPVWTDENGAAVGHGAIVVVVQRIHGLHGEFGSTVLTPRHSGTLSVAMGKAPHVGLHDELMADAQTAAVQGNMRRAVLELAIACEVFVKQTFFDSRGRAGQVYEALENKRQIKAGVLEILDIGGAATFSKSFRDHDPAARLDLEHLFRARNKVAHRGEAYFIDDAGRRHVVDRKIMSRWWRTMEKLISGQLILAVADTDNNPTENGALSCRTVF